MPGSGALAPLEQIVAQWKDERDNDQEDDEPEAEGGIYTVMSHPRRIPIAGSRWWDGDNTYLDLHPAPKGTEGQLIMFTSECDPRCSARASALRSRAPAGPRLGEWVFDAKKGHVRDAALRSRHLELPQEGSQATGAGEGRMSVAAVKRVKNKRAAR
ncbi:MAG: hypothetical protein IPJ34_07885 [Myxococcales bacterium]|nr:hypothetical protein [Myxococcales bacterium]